MTGDIITIQAPGGSHANIVDGTHTLGGGNRDLHSFKIRKFERKHRNFLAIATTAILRFVFCERVGQEERDIEADIDH